MKINVIAVDLAKNVFQVHGYSSTGERVLAKRVNRVGFQRLLEGLERDRLVVMEACGASHYWGRVCYRLGHRVQLLAAQHVRPYVVGNKTDSHDADAIYEASRRGRLRSVPVKTLEAQDVMLSHRMRERRKKARVALVNQIRGFLAERGLVCGQGVAKLRSFMRDVIARGASGEVTATLVTALEELQAEWRTLDEELMQAERRIRKHARSTPACRRLETTPGIGVLTSSAAVALAGDGSSFESSRQFSSWVGVTPKEHSSGEQRHLGGITKRGDGYLRMLLVHGARAVVAKAKYKEDAFSRWVVALIERRGYNKAVVAVANKNARIIWALLRSDDVYRPASG